jgi:transcription initiation factor TFIIB
MNCPNCGSSRICISREKEVVCEACGMVIEENTIDNSEFAIPSNQNIAIIPELSEARTKPVNGKIISSGWLLTNKEKALNKAKTRINLIGSHLNLPNRVMQEALILYKKCQEKEINSGRDNQSITYACVYIACLLHDIPKMPREILLGIDIPKRKFMKTYRVIKKKLHIKTNFPNPIDLVPRFASKLDLKPKFMAKISETIIKLEESELMIGKNPMTTLATAIWIIVKKYHLKITQRMVTNATGVLEVTIRKRAREVIEKLV